MTKKHFERAAEMVKSIRDGNWTNEPPSWADGDRAYTPRHNDLAYRRAVQTAEAFLQLFNEYNPRFDEQRFLVACGLVEAPVKVKRSRIAEHQTIPQSHFRGGYRCDNNPNGPTEN